MSTKRYDKTFLITLLIILFMIQGCASRNVPVTPAGTSSNVAATTFLPSDTSPSTAIITSTPAPANTATAFPTLTSAPLESSETSTDPLDLSQMIVEEWASTSPNGNWVAAGLVAFPKLDSGDQQAYVRLMVFSADGKMHWTIFDEWKEIGLGFPFPAPLRWSQDGRYFYFTHRVTPDGCSAFPLLTNLQRLDLEDGTVEELLSHSALALALAPDEAKVAYVGDGDRGLVLKDFVTGEERETKINPGKDFNAGNLVWSPDGTSLALTLAIHPCTGDYGVSKTVWAESTTIIQVDVETLEQRVLVAEDPRLFITWEWNESARITVVDGEENSVWYLNVNTGEITRE